MSTYIVHISIYVLFIENSDILKQFPCRLITFKIVGNLCLIYFKITWALAILLDKKFEINWTKIKGSCQSGRKVATQDSKSDLPLAWCMMEVCNLILQSRTSLSYPPFNIEKGLLYMYILYMHSTPQILGITPYLVFICNQN